MAALILQYPRRVQLPREVVYIPLRASRRCSAPNFSCGITHERGADQEFRKSGARSIFLLRSRGALARVGSNQAWTSAVSNPSVSRFLTEHGHHLSCQQQRNESSCDSILQKTNRHRGLALSFGSVCIQGPTAPSANAMVCCSIRILMNNKASAAARGAIFAPTSRSRPTESANGKFAPPTRCQRTQPIIKLLNIPFFAMRFFLLGFLFSALKSALIAFVSFSPEARFSHLLELMSLPIFSLAILIRHFRLIRPSGFTATTSIGSGSFIMVLPHHFAFLLRNDRVAEN